MSIEGTEFLDALRIGAERAGVPLPARRQVRSNGSEPKQQAAANTPIDAMIESIPVDDDRLKLARALEPVLQCLAGMPRADVQAILWHKVKPRFNLTHKDCQGYERALSELRRELKAEAKNLAKTQAEADLRRKQEDAKRELADRSLKLLGTEVSLIDLHSRLRELLGDLGDLLEITLAVSAIATVRPPVWLFVVGAPSSGKTELVRLLRASPNVYYLDTMTENAFVSGYVRPDGSEPKDLLPLLDGKTFVCKDLTTLFSLQEDTIRKLLGDLCGIYDGQFRKHTATRGDISYESSFSFLACITPAALNTHHRYLNLIGPRFLTYRVPPLTAQQVDKGFDALWQNSSRGDQLDALRDLVSAFSFQLSKCSIGDVQTDETSRRYLKRMSGLLARGRGVIVTNRSKFTDAEGQEREWVEVVEAQVEEPWRGYQQIETLARALALVHSRDRVTAHELQLVRRVTLASMPPARGDALAQFADPTVVAQGYVVAAEMGERLETSTKTARNLLDELHALKILTKDKEGVQAARYAPYREFADLVVEPRSEIDHIVDYLRG